MGGEIIDGGADRSDVILPHISNEKRKRKVVRGGGI